MFNEDEILSLASNSCWNEDLPCEFCKLATPNGCLVSLVREAKAKLPTAN